MATDETGQIQYRYSRGQFNGWIIERSKNFGKTWHPIGDYYADEEDAQKAADRLNEIEGAKP